MGEQPRAEPVMEAVRHLHERMVRIADEARSALHDAEQDLPEEMMVVDLSYATGGLNEAAGALDNAATSLLDAAKGVLNSTRRRGDETDAALSELRAALAQRPGA